MGPCAGGAVYSPAITDFIFMVKETSHMFITGPDVIKTVTGEEVEFEELGGAMSHNSKSGVAHFASDDEDQCLEDTRYLFSFLPQNNLETAPRVLPTDDPMRMDPELDDDRPGQPEQALRHARRRARDRRRRRVLRGPGALRAEHHLRLLAPERLLGRRRRQPAARDGRRARHRRQLEGGALRAHLRRVQHPAADLRRRAGLPARAPRRSGAASSATARSCCTPSPRRRCRRSR